MTTTWRQIKINGSANRYEISDKGIVRNYDTCKNLKPYRHDGYWYYSFSLKGMNANGARRSVKIKRARLLATAFIPNPSCLPIIDHINMKRSDDRIDNLRWSTKQRNNANRPAKRNRQHSKFKGVGYDARVKTGKPWFAQICVNGRVRNLGRFHTEKEAARAYNDAAQKAHGKYARLNRIAGAPAEQIFAV